MAATETATSNTCGWAETKSRGPTRMSFSFIASWMTAEFRTGHFVFWRIYDAAGGGSNHGKSPGIRSIAKACRMNVHTVQKAAVQIEFALMKKKPSLSANRLICAKTRNSAGDSPASSSR
jgi:hypothetical protein